MSFLPKNYEPPQTGNYFKFNAGANKFRILAEAIVGNVFWSTDGDGNRHPTRCRGNVRITDDMLSVDSRSGKLERPKHFWAFPVWNHSAEQVQILEITQATIREGLMALDNNSDWGDPVNAYDITVTKSGSGLDTTYTVMPSTKAPTSADITKQYTDLGVDMEKLFDGDDPFTGEAVPEKTQDNVSTTSVDSVTQRKNAEGHQVYCVSTSDGMFFTDKQSLADTASDSDGDVEIHWTKNAKGGRVIDKIQQMAEVDSDDIPF